MTLRTLNYGNYGLNYGNYGIFLIMGNAGSCPSTVVEPFGTLTVPKGSWDLVSRAPLRDL